MMVYEPMNLFFFFYLFSGVFLLKRQKVLQQQERKSIKRKKIMQLTFFLSFSPESEWCLAEQRTLATITGLLTP
jgi:hypothetical protein